VALELGSVGRKEGTLPNVANEPDRRASGLRWKNPGWPLR